MMKAIIFAGAFLCLNSCKYLAEQKTVWADLFFLPLQSHSLFAEMAVFMVLVTATIFVINSLESFFSKSAVVPEVNALQVAHDIRAPLQLISLKLNENCALKNDPVLKSALYRVNAIAEELLHKSKIKEEHCAVIETLKNIIEEKKYLCRNIAHQIEFRLDSNVLEAISPIDSHQFERIMSNLLNNSIEARNPSIKILIKAELRDNFLTISVKDNGKGIPEDKLAQIRQGLLSFGKKNGHGLGIKHALQYLKSIGSYLQIDSLLNVGTQVSFKLPVEKSEFPVDLDLKSRQVVLIEDEKYIRKFWERSAAQKGIELHSFESIESFKKKSKDFNKDAVYFIDSNLKLDSTKGEDFAKELKDHGAKEIYLVTGHEASHFTSNSAITAVLEKTPPWEKYFK
ncbi:MAG: hypothetical protein Fur0010_22510 [Bdellovibrio sp.]